MNSQCYQQSQIVNDAELHRFVADALRDQLHGNSRVLSVDRQLYDYRSSFAIEELTAHLDDGTKLPLIFKNLSHDNLLNEARLTRPLHIYDPAREIIVYRELLPQLSLGAPTCYAAVADAEQQRYWLLLEKAPGSDLARSRGFAVWSETAAWLAEAQRKLTDALSQCRHPQHLMRYDRSCFDYWIDRAERSLNPPLRAEGGEVAPWEIKWLLERARATSRLIDSLPVSFIHGEFYASNVLINEDASAGRICTLDWETAGTGPALLDLAALISGNWTEAQKAEIASSYFDTQGNSAADSCGPVDQLTALRCCQLLLAMKWIGWSSDWQPPPEHRHDWLAEALELARELNTYLPPL